MKLVKYVQEKPLKRGSMKKTFVFEVKMYENREIKFMKREK